MPILENLQFGLPPKDIDLLAKRLLKEVDGDFPAAIARAWRMGSATYHNVFCGRRTCRICGCWNMQACDPACHWVAEDLCSACGTAEA